MIAAAIFYFFAPCGRAESSENKTNPVAQTPAASVTPTPAATATLAPQPTPDPAELPVLSVDSEVLQPESVIEITFKRPVAKVTELNNAAEPGIVEVSPALPGRLVWKSERVARYDLSEPPLPGTEYTFSLGSGTAALGRTGLAPCVIGKVKSVPFKVERMERLGSYDGNLDNRIPNMICWFTADVSAETVASRYIDKSGKTISAKVRQATEGETRNFFATPKSLRQRFEERPGTSKAASTPEPAKETPVAHAVVISPSEILPVGQDWQLIVSQGFGSKVGGGGLQDTFRRHLGSIVEMAPTGMDHFSYAGGDRRMVIHFNAQLFSGDDEPRREENRLEELRRVQGLVEVTPAVKGMKIEINWRDLTITGAFEVGTHYHLRVKPGIKAKNGTITTREFTKDATFKACEPSLGLPSYETAQLANGRRKYDVQSVNMKSVRVRIKALSGTELVRALQAYDSYTGVRRDSKDLRHTGALPFELVSGTVVHDKLYSFEKSPVDAIDLIHLDWTKMLGGTKPAALFISTEGRHRDNLGTEKANNMVTQALVQVTDLGVLWKKSMDGVQLYVFSCQTGEPVPGAEVQFFGEDAKEFKKFETDRQGILRFATGDKVFTIKVRKGDDQFCLIFDNNLPRIPRYRFPISSTYEIPSKHRNVVTMFTDRHLYRPGETMHLKGIWRERLDTDLRIPKERQVNVSIRDEDDRVVSEKKVTLSDLGTFAETFELPASTVGKFSAVVDLPKPDKKAGEKAGQENQMEDGEGGDGDEEGDEIYDNAQRYSFSETFIVQEFRRNTFEVHLKAPEPPRGAAEAEVNLTANYLMGKPLSDGKISWSVHTNPVGFYPERYSGYYFGDHAKYDRYYWYRYFGFRDYDSGSEEDDREAKDGKTGEATLDPAKPTSIRFALPKYDFPSRIGVNFRAEVTDANQQTLAESVKYQVPSSEFYIGMNRIDSLVHVGSKIPLGFIVVDNNGQPFKKPVQATLTVEHESWTTSSTRTANGDTATQSESSRKEVFRQEISLKGDAPVVVQYTPAKAGSHYVIIRSKDASGAVVATRVKLNAYGTADYAFEYEDGARIRMVPDKKEYQPGETAKILVQTPVDGTALVTLERSRIHRSYVTKLSASSPVIEVPITDADAPNVYVSVTLIKGAKENRREVKEPIAKIGYCNVKVKDRADRLAVRLTPAKEVVRPGVETFVEGAVTNSKNAPVANAEVTLWAVDEGVLQVAGYVNPDFLAALLPGIPLGVLAGTTLPMFLSERPDAIEFVNKGFVAGGGGFTDAGKLRIDFNPCPLWIATLKTDAKGAFRADFKVPDSLTRFRVLAVAVAGARQFGNATSAITVNKPLMLQPIVPRVAYVGDRLQVKTMVHNTSKTGGEFEITLNTSKGCLIDDGAGAKRSAFSKRLHLGINESRAVAFDVTFETTDEAKWNWKAVTISTDQKIAEGDKAELVDSVQSKFPVNYPLPIFRETAFVRLNGNEEPLNLLSRLTPELLNGSGELTVEISASILTEAGTAIEHILHYPYGCVEQSTSSLAPWFAAKDLRDYVPSMRKSDAEIADAIQRGANRLLSMQTSSGGLSYWPGGAQPCEWGSAYGGMGLLLARENGAVVPEEAINKLTTYLSSLLRREPNYRGVSETRARILYVLSLAGKPEPAYVANMVKDAAKFGPTTRAFLAMAMVKGGGSKEEARSLLELRPTSTPEESDMYFLWRTLDIPMELTAWCMVDPSNERVIKLVNSLISLRTREGHWGATMNNAWSLNALAAYARTVEQNREDVTCELKGMGISERFTFSPQAKAKQIRIPLVPSTEAPKLVASVQKNALLFYRIALVSRPKIVPALTMGSPSPARMNS